jgi:hypothetical protein
MTSGDLMLSSPLGIVDIALACLGEVEFAVAIDFGQGMNVVHERIGILDAHRLAHHDSEHVGIIIAADLVQFDHLGRGGEFFAFQPFGNINEDIGQAVVLAHDVVAGGRDGWLEFAASVIVLDGDRQAAACL